MDDASRTPHPNASASANASNSANVNARASRQIRSRVTVVCGECKRLKLKCDLRHPCGSCAKRGTVARCVYSPGAAEKVDVASLNNRLIPVEALLTLLTGGQFQSTYPLAADPAAALPMGFSLDPAALSAVFGQPASPRGSSSLNTSQAVHGGLGEHEQYPQHHTHYHHRQASRHINGHRISNSVFLSGHDLALALLEDLELELDLDVPFENLDTFTTTNTTSNTTNANMDTTPTTSYIKLEPPPSYPYPDFDLQPYPPSSSSSSTAYRPPIDFGSSGTERHNIHRVHPRTEKRRRTQAHRLYLPALSIYYPVPSVGSAPSAFPSPLPPPSHPPFGDLASPHSPSSTPTTTTVANQFTYPPQIQLLPHPPPPPPPPPSSSSSSSQPQTQPHRTPRTASPHPHPRITPALLALLPPRGVCERWLRRARSVLGTRVGVGGLLAKTSAPASAGTEAMGGSGGGGGGGKGKAKERMDGKEGRDGRERVGGREEQWRAFESRCLRVLSSASGFGSSSASSSSLTSAPAHSHAPTPIRTGHHQRKKGKTQEGESERRDRKDKESKRKEREKARMIYFGGAGGGVPGPGLQGQTPTTTTSPRGVGSGRRRSGVGSASGAGAGGAGAGAGGSASGGEASRREQHRDRERDRPPQQGSDPGQPESSAPEPDYEESLAFFALLCFVLAVGGSSPSHFPFPSQNSPSPSSSPVDERWESGTETHEFLFELGRQAMGVWDTDTCCSSYGGKEREREKAEYVLACVVGVVYLVRRGAGAWVGVGSGHILGDGDEDGEKEEEEEGDMGAGTVTSLVGKMISAARALGLDRLAGANAKTGSKGKRKGPAKEVREKETQEWKRMLWWEVLFWDLFTADAQQRAPLVPLDVYLSSALPSCAGFRPSEALGVQNDYENENEEDGEEGEVDDAHEREHEEEDDEEAEDERRYRPVLRLDEGEVTERGGEVVGEVVGEEEMGEEGEEAYVGARHCLTHLTALIKDAIARPACRCCGYTLEEALVLEGEVGRFGAGLPASLRFAPSAPSSLATSFGTASPLAFLGQGQDERKAKGDEGGERKARAAELAMMAGLLVLMVYKPFILRGRGRGGKNTGGSVPVPVPVPGPAYEASVRAARGVLGAARELFVLHKSTAMGGEGETPAPAPAGTTFLDLYPLDKTLFEACVICAHAVLRPRPLSSSCFGYAPAAEREREKERMGLQEEVVSALDLLLSSSDTNTSLTDRQRRVVVGLRRRLGRSAGAGAGGIEPGVSGERGTKSGVSGKGRIKAGEVTPTRVGLKRRREEDEDGDGDGGGGGGGAGGAGRGFGGSINLHPNPGTAGTSTTSASTTSATTTTTANKTAMEHHISGNGAAGAGAGEGMVSGFDFDGAATHSHSHYNPFPTLQYPPLHLQPQMHVEQGQSQHLYNAIPAIQEQHGGMMDLSSSSSPTNLGQYTHSDEYQKFERGLSSPAALAPAFTQHRQQQQLHQGSAGMTHLQGSTSIEAASMTSPSTSTSVADPLTRLTDLGRNSGSGGTDELQKMGDADRERQRERVREKERNPERERGNSKEKDKEKGKDKDRKHTKKTYPAVGIRVRDRASNPLLQRRQPEVSASTTTAETVRAYQEQQKKLAAAAVDMAGGQGQEQGASPAQAPSPVLASMAAREREAAAFGQTQTQSTFGIQQQQPQQHPQPPPFGPHPRSQMFEHSPFPQHRHEQSPLQQPHPHPHSQSMFADTMAYNPVSSPFAAASNASSSPFASTPTFGSQQQQQQQHTPPLFEPPPPPPPLQTSSPAMYFHPHTPSAYGSSYGGSPALSGPQMLGQSHGQGMQLDNMGLDQPMLSVPSTPVYEETQEMQAGMYEVKPALESLQRHHLPQPRQMQHHQQQQDQMQAQYHQVYDREMSAPGQQQQQQSGPGMGVSASSPWSTQQQQQAPAESQAFWNPGGEHKFPSGY